LSEVDRSAAQVISRKVYNKDGRIINSNRGDRGYGYPSEMSEIDIQKLKKREQNKQYYAPRDHNGTVRTIYYHRGVSTKPLMDAVERLHEHQYKRECIPEYRLADISDFQQEIRIFGL
jgi:hypothetical protein